MAFIRYAFTVSATGKHVAMKMHHYWKFRDGKACYVRSSEDPTGRRGPDTLTRSSRAVPARAQGHRRLAVLVAI